MTGKAPLDVKNVTLYGHIACHRQNDREQVISFPVIIYISVEISSKYI